MTHFRGVLLDVDGTLIDSNDAHAHAWVDVFREFGFDVPFERVRPLIGMGGDKLLPRCTGVESETERGKTMTARRMELFKARYLPHLHAFPGAHELLTRFKKDGLVLVVATSAKEEELNELLTQAGLDELIDRKTSSSDADHSKPDPDIIQAALTRGHLQVGEAVMLGDTPYDIEAAAKAGIPAIAVRCGGWDDRALSGAAEIYDDVRDLLNGYSGSLLTP